MRRPVPQYAAEGVGSARAGQAGCCSPLAGPLQEPSRWRRRRLQRRPSRRRTPASAAAGRLTGRGDSPHPHLPAAAAIPDLAQPRVQHAPVLRCSVAALPGRGMITRSSRVLSTHLRLCGTATAVGFPAAILARLKGRAARSCTFPHGSKIRIAQSHAFGLAPPVSPGKISRLLQRRS